MKQIDIVVGAGYGDEGKGVTVDYLAAHYIALGNKPTVIRGNGGAQAGHTVTTPGSAGVRHVFHHFGSGALAGAATYLSKWFLTNPILFEREFRELNALCANGIPPVTISPDSAITTPYDMTINQLLERQRGGARHGSCGVGIHETVLRETPNDSGLFPHTFTVGWLEHQRYLSSPVMGELDGTRAHFIEAVSARLQYLREEYYLPRLRSVITDPALLKEGEHLIHHPGLEANFILCCFNVLSLVKVADFMLEAATNDEPLIYEMSQGLLLDKDHENFPHVTPSSTGLKNPIEDLKEFERPFLVTTYMVTRAYQTRHGAGPFPDEAPLGFSIEDQTNTPHDFQGTLRYAPFNYSTYSIAVAKEDYYAWDAMAQVKNCLGVGHACVVTCLDQIADQDIVVIANNGFGSRLRLSGAAAVAWFEEHFDFVSRSPTRATFAPCSEFGRQVEHERSVNFKRKHDKIQQGEQHG